MPCRSSKNRSRIGAAAKEGQEERMDEMELEAVF